MLTTVVRIKYANKKRKNPEQQKMGRGQKKHSSFYPVTSVLAKNNKYLTTGRTIRSAAQQPLGYTWLRWFQNSHIDLKQPVLYIVFIQDSEYFNWNNSSIASGSKCGNLSTYRYIITGDDTCSRNPSYTLSWLVSLALCYEITMSCKLSFKTKHR